MTRGNVPKSLPNGEGFGDEDYVAAGVLVDMLLKSMPLGAEVGCVTRIIWSGTGLGRKLDDVVLTLVASNEQYIAECSLKQRKQVTKNGFPFLIIRPPPGNNDSTGNSVTRTHSWLF